jgi:hypothetical protein
MLNANDVYGNQFIGAYKIHEICEGMNLSKDDARLFTYIHEIGRFLGLKPEQLASDAAWKYINSVSDSAVESLTLSMSLMQGDDFYEDVRQAAGKKTVSTDESMLSDVMSSLGKGLDAYKENVANFHKNMDFNREKIGFYINEIAPRMDSTDVSEKINALKKNF